MSEPTRHSQAFDAEIITDPDLRARQEALNGLKQFDAGGALRLRQREVERKKPTPSCGICDVAVELDSSVYRWQRPDVARGVVHDSLRQAGVRDAGKEHHPGSDRRR